MSVLALIRNSEEIALVVPWAAEFAIARGTSLDILCWQYAPIPQQSSLMNEENPEEAEVLADSVREFITQVIESKTVSGDDSQQVREVALYNDADIYCAAHPSATEAMLERIRQEQPELAVAAAEDQSGETSSQDTILLQSPSHTVILYGRAHTVKQKRHIFVGTANGSHDGTAIYLASQVSRKLKKRITVARFEEDSGEASVEVGRIELLQRMRDVGVRPNDRIRRRVFLTSDFAGVCLAAEKHDLVMIGANSQFSAYEILGSTESATVAVIKRAPPLRPWQDGKRRVGWIPRISPSDYADLVQKLRRGSSLSQDFLIMLGLASAVASLGLLQDSPAIVIGSMLLAPLMTPMIGNGLALAQANPKLGRNALLSVFAGSVLTLMVSFFIAIVTPGEEMTPQVLSRGEPNILDLLVAIFSAMAAAYAMARPGLAGSVAGVAIATALVPPLCSAGISLAYGRYLIAQGAGILFVSNLVAIILGAAITFRFMGVSSKRAGVHQRRWVFRMVAVLGVILISLAFPLQHALQRNIDTGKPQPSNYPLTKAVEDALMEYVERTPELQLIASGRPSSEHDFADVVLIITAPQPIPESYADKLIEIVRREMEDDELIVEVHCLQAAWQRK